MPLDPALLGTTTPPLTSRIEAADIQAFTQAIGDSNPVFQTEEAAQRAGFAQIPAPPTFVTRFHVEFAAIGLDPSQMQVLHGEQEYLYQRPILAGETLTVQFQITSLRQSARAGGMAIMAIEQSGNVAGERVVIGRSTLIVRDASPESAAAATNAATNAAAPRAKPSAAPTLPTGTQLPTLTKHVTQEMVNAYAEVSGDHNPIHLDPDAARAVGLEGTIAHGMLSMAFLGQLLTAWLAAQPTPGGWVARLRVRFQAMVRPGDTLTCQGILGERSGDRQRADLWIENAQGERVLSGDADLVVAAPASQ